MEPLGRFGAFNCGSCPTSWLFAVKLMMGCNSVSFARWITNASFGADARAVFFFCSFSAPFLT